MSILGHIIIKRNHDSGEAKAGDQELWSVREKNTDKIEMLVQHHSKFDGYFKGRCFSAFIGEFPKNNWRAEIEWFFYYQLRCDIIENDCDIPCMDVIDWFRSDRRKSLHSVFFPEED